MARLPDPTTFTLLPTDAQTPTPWVAAIELPDGVSVLLIRTDGGGPPAIAHSWEHAATHFGVKKGRVQQDARGEATPNQTFDPDYLAMLRKQSDEIYAHGPKPTRRPQRGAEREET